MKQNYSIKWLIENYEQGVNLEFIYFWGHSNKYKEEIGKFCFSQWFQSEFVVNEIIFKTSEHWMMAQKALLFNDFENFEKLLVLNLQRLLKKQDVK